MIESINKLQQIYIVFFCFIVLTALFAFTRDTNVFTLANTALGAVIGLAMKTNRPAQSVNVENMENAGGISPGGAVKTPVAGSTEDEN